MHSLIATAGALPPLPVADFIEQSTPSRVSVLTVVEVPRPFVQTLDDSTWHPLRDAEASLDRQGELERRYVEERGRKRTAPIVASLRARGIECEPIYREGNEPAAVIGKVAEELDVDLIIMGSTRPIFTEGSWRSVSIRVMQLTRRPLLLSPGLAPTSDPDEAEANQRIIERELAT